MPVSKLHPDEVDIDEALVRSLLRGQFPEWADLPLELVEPVGTDNVTLRLGRELGVRLPRKAGAAAGIATEQDVVPLLAPYLSVVVPLAVGRGEPAAGYPFRWTVHPWLTGSNPQDADDRLAAGLGDFARELRSIDTFGMTPTGPLRSYRMDPIALRDADVREAVATCEEIADKAHYLAVWDRLREVDHYAGPPVWSHCDLTPGNLLVDARGALAAVIDWGGLALGDPALDCMPAWNLCTGATRPTFRQHAAVDDATWERARAWTFAIGLVALAYYHRSDNRQIIDYSRHALSQVMAQV